MKKVINNIKEYYEKLGGKLHLDSPVNKINVEDKKVETKEDNENVIYVSSKNNENY